jgi:hypothetical protein
VISTARRLDGAAARQAIWLVGLAGLTVLWGTLAAGLMSASMYAAPPIGSESGRYETLVAMTVLGIAGLTSLVFAFAYLPRARRWSARWSAVAILADGLILGYLVVGLAASALN